MYLQLRGLELLREVGHRLEILAVVFRLEDGFNDLQPAVEEDESLVCFLQPKSLGAASLLKMVPFTLKIRRNCKLFYFIF